MSKHQNKSDSFVRSLFGNGRSRSRLHCFIRYIDDVCALGSALYSRTIALAKSKTKIKIKIKTYTIMLENDSNLKVDLKTKRSGRSIDRLSNSTKYRYANVMCARERAISLDRIRQVLLYFWLAFIKNVPN